MSNTPYSLDRSTAHGQSPGTVHNEEVRRARERGLPPPPYPELSLGKIRDSSTTLPPPPEMIDA